MLRKKIQELLKFENKTYPQGLQSGQAQQLSWLMVCEELLRESDLLY